MNHNHTPAAITGIGLVTPAGIGRAANWTTVCAGRPTARHTPHLHHAPVTTACTVPSHFDPDTITGKRITRTYDRSTQLALVAAHAALRDATLDTSPGLLVGALGSLPWVGPVVLCLLLSPAIRSLAMEIHYGTRFRVGYMARHRFGAFCLAVSITALIAYFGGPHVFGPLLGVVIFVGMLVHNFGDSLTNSGIPWKALIPASLRPVPRPAAETGPEVRDVGPQPLGSGVHAVQRRQQARPAHRAPVGALLAAAGGRVPARWLGSAGSVGRSARGFALVGLTRTNRNPPATGRGVSCFRGSSTASAWSRECAG